MGLIFPCYLTNSSDFHKIFIYKLLICLKLSLKEETDWGHHEAIMT